MKKMLVLCHGNTCRSPMAEGYLKKMFEDIGKPVHVESAGFLSVKKPLPSHHYAVRVMSDRRIDISRHKSRCIKGLDLFAYDFILVMNGDQKKQLLEKYGLSPDDVIILNFPNGIENPNGKDLNAYYACSETLYFSTMRVGNMLLNIL